MLAEKQRLRRVNERKAFLINELERLNYKFGRKRMSDFTLVELEQIHINEKCRIANNPVLREVYAKTM